MAREVSGNSYDRSGEVSKSGDLHYPWCPERNYVCRPEERSTQAERIESAIQYLESAGFQVKEPTFTTSQAAKLLGLTAKEVVALVDSGDLRTVNPSREFHKWRRIPQSALYEYNLHALQD